VRAISQKTALRGFNIAGNTRTRRFTHPLEVKGGGNLITQKYYIEYVLPKHIDTIKRLEERYKHRYTLQEENNGSHGTRSLHETHVEGSKLMQI